MANTLAYNVMKTPDGYIATCEANYRISVFSKDEAQLDDVIHAAARLYAKVHPGDPHEVLKDNKIKMERRN